MNVTKIVLSIGAVATLVGGVSLGIVHGVEQEAPAAITDEAVITARVNVEAGQFAYEMTAAGARISDTEHYGELVVTGSSSRPSVSRDEIKSKGYVAGGTTFENSVTGAHLSGVAGEDVLAVTVIPTASAPVHATVVDGLWAAAWNGVDEDYGAARVEFTTTDGRIHTVTTDDIDWIAVDE